MTLKSYLVLKSCLVCRLSLVGSVMMSLARAEGDAGRVFSAFEIREPLGHGWTGQWFRHGFTIPEGTASVAAEDLVVRKIWPALRGRRVLRRRR